MSKKHWRPEDHTVTPTKEESPVHEMTRATHPAEQPVELLGGQIHPDQQPHVIASEPAPVPEKPADYRPSVGHLIHPGAE